MLRLLVSEKRHCRFVFDILIGELDLRDLPRYPDTQDLYDTLNHFQTGRSHMACVYSVETNEATGIVTLEDIIEELIQEEIMDEADLAYEYTKKAEKLMKQAEMLRKGISLDKVKRRERKSRVSHHKSNSTGGPGVKRSKSVDLFDMDDLHKINSEPVVLLSDEEIKEDLHSDHHFLRSSAPTSPVIPRSDEDFV